MFDFGRMIECRTDRFPSHLRDEELVNGGLGFALADYIATQLGARGMPICALVAEDWGWYAERDHADFRLGFGITSFGPQDFLIQFMPDTPVIRKLFRKIDTRAATTALASAVFDILRVEGVVSGGPTWVDEVSATLGDEPIGEHGSRQ